MVNIIALPLVLVGSVLLLLSNMHATTAANAPAFAWGGASPKRSTTKLAATVNNVDRSKSTSSKSMSTSISTRKKFFQEIGIAGIAAAIFSTSSAGRPSPAFAADEILSMDSSPTTGSILASSSLRNLKRAEKQLSKMEFYAVENDYEQMKSAIRNPPFSEIRKNSFQLIRNFQGDQSQQDKMQASYEKFIASLEKMDSTASLGMRGRKLDNGALLQTYDATKKALSEWIEVASSVTQEGTA